MRNFCASCQAKRSVLFAEKLTSEILAPVPHRHWTFSIPRVLRGLVERDRKLMGLLSQTAYAAIRKTFQAFFGRSDVAPGSRVIFRRRSAGRRWSRAPSGRSASPPPEAAESRHNPGISSGRAGFHRSFPHRSSSTMFPHELD